LAVYRRTRIAFGTPMNLHLFRDAGFSFLALHAPEQVHVARDLLGHKHISTGQKYYLQGQNVAVARTVADILASKLRRFVIGPADLPLCAQLRRS
jgi:integrase